MKFVVVSEAELDFKVASELADRVIVQETHWMDESDLASMREWSGVEPGYAYLKLSAMKSVESRVGFSPKVTGSFGEGPFYTTARRAMLIIEYVKEKQDLDVGAVVFIADSDGDKERIAGIESAIANSPWTFKSACALPHPSIEAWILVGFVPTTPEEETLLAQIRSDISLDPTREPHRCNGPAGDPRNIKNITNRICSDDYERKRQCWSETALDELKNRSGETNLREFLDAVRDEFVPLFEHRP